MSKFIDNLEKSHGIKLTEKQRVIAEHADGPALVLSCAGSGKTTVNIIKCANLILEHGVNPKNILSVTFSKAAATEMRNRFNSMFGNLINESVKFSTIHSLAYTIVKNYGNRHDVTVKFIDGEDSEISKIMLLKELHARITKKNINEDKLEELVSKISYCKNMMLSIGEVKKLDADMKHFSEIYYEYENYKYDNKLIDFDDMLTLANSYLKEDKQLLTLFRKHFKYIIVDEAQDTSKVQYEIIEKLAYPNNNLTLIGDDDQAIYSFRGACPEYLLEFNKKFSNASIFYMDENFRSTKCIVEHANNIIKSNIKRYDKNIITSNEEGAAVRVVELSEDTQFQYIMNEIGDKENKGDYAILYRNNITSIAMANMLDKKGIPFYLRDAKSLFFKHWVTQDILAFFRVAMNPMDIEAYSRIYSKTEHYIKKDAIAHMESNPGKNVFESLLSYYDGNRRMLPHVNSIKSGFERLSNLNPLQAIHHIEAALNYTKYLEKNAEKFGYSIESLIEILNTLELIAETTETFEGFVNRIEELQARIENSRFNRNKNAVVLSTIHAAKGLEFKEVYLVNLIDDVFPGREAVKNLKEGKFEEMEEERRIYYVAITRAKEKLTLFGIKRKSYKRVVYSRFLYESMKYLEPVAESGTVKDATKSEFKSKLSLEELGEGDRVFHRKFGEGTIIEMDSEAMTVEFDDADYGIKKLLLEFTRNSGIVTPA